jgi:hypothetical protein
MIVRLALSYTSPNVFTKDVAIAPLSPSVSGGAVVSYSIAPALPLGLSFDTALWGDFWNAFGDLS